MNIWICGRGDHSFLVLSAQGGIVAGTSDNDANIFSANDVIVDLWLFNVARQRSGRVANANMASTVANFDLIQGANDIHVFVRYN
jgi:hypothetical protein